MRYKVEIIDNQIGDYYELNLFVWKRRKWWSKENWNFECGHTLGKKYMCPEIRNGWTTVEEMFDEEIHQVLEREGIEEVHRIVISKN